MARSLLFTSLLVTSALVFVVAGDCSAGVCDEDDEAAFIQHRTTILSAEVREHAHTSEDDGNETKQNSIDLMLKNVAGTKPLPGGISDAITNAENMVVAKAMKAIASTLNNLLDSLKKEVDRLGEEGDTQTKKLQGLVEAVNNTVKARVAIMESKLEDTLDPVLDRWSALATSLETTSTSITGALKTADKTQLANSLGAALNNIVAKLNSFVTGVRGAEARVNGLGEVKHTEVAKRIYDLDTDMKKATELLADFPVEFGGVIAELKEGIITALPKDVPAESKTAVIEAFEAVQAKAEELSTDVLKTAKNFVDGLTTSVLKIPVEMPSPSPHSGSSHATSCFGLLVASYIAAMRII
eukprot:gnl/TRDRNA2_/TRDRNA2_67312_c0_seq2.p1 gnl/TRDRNA2_/TRDRNA2_67312_c0~~gnl/TRDRNA2_/TRDRNA2_67312_c0_seq2.p1  ORF type:complete len:355 (+),score=80.75 gnl/TRDRNA2_/TRDRNA2_67312_c0_seq2:83-1147(+)